MNVAVGRALLLARAKRLEPVRVQRFVLRFAEQNDISTCAVRISGAFRMGPSDEPMRFVELLAGTKGRLDRLAAMLPAADHGLLCLRLHAESGLGAVLFYEDGKVVSRTTILRRDPDALSKAIGDGLERLIGYRPAAPLPALSEALARFSPGATTVLVRDNGAPADPSKAGVELGEDWASHFVDEEVERAIAIELARPDAARIVRRAGALLDARRQADRDARARAAVEVAESKFWAACGGLQDRHALTAIFVAGGLAEELAATWSRRVLRPDDAEEDDHYRNTCANCGSGTDGDSCTVCGHRAGAAPEVDRDRERARHLVASLLAADAIALATPGAEAGLIAQTAFLLREADTQSEEQIAEAIEEAWMARDDVAEIFVDAEAIAEALRRT